MPLKRERTLPPTWPCPHGCNLWARIDGLETFHHPRCSLVDESLIDVWKVSLDGSSFYTEDEASARMEASDDPEGQITVERVKMHREIYENPPEFGGF